MHAFSRTLCAVAISSLLAACGGGSSSSNNDSNPGGDNGGGTPPVEQPYACDISANQQHNNLRIYQVMVESFIDGDASHDYNAGYGSSHHQGDIRGIINSLDYIADLGMNAIWLTPIFESVPLSAQDEWADRLDATGYFASNYFAIDPKFGSLDDARELVEKAHERGLYVFFDGVFGHHKSNAPDYPSPGGLVVSNGKGQGATGYEAVYPNDLEFHQEVASYWIKQLKIDGWRVDQAYQVPVEAWSEIRRTVDEASAAVTYTNKQGETVNPLGYMVAEIWDSAGKIAEQGYGNAQQPGLCSSFDFPMRYKVVEALAANDRSKSHNMGGAWLSSGFATHSSYPDYAQPNLMLGNHDLVRFGDLLQRANIAQPGSDEYRLRHEAAFAFMAAYTGPITLYYGEEIGDEVAGFDQRVDCENDKGVGARAGLCDDHVARSSAKIAGIAPQVGEPVTVLDSQQSKLLERLQALMAMRSQHPALYTGERTHIRSSADIYIDHKQAGNDTVLFVLSTSDEAQTVTLSSAEIGSDGTLVDLLGDSNLTISGDQYQFELPAFGARFYSLSSPTAEGPQPGAIGGDLSGSGFMAACDNPVQSGGPLGEALYVVGDFADASWEHVAARQMSYRGENTYQVVVDEPAGGFSFQIAAKDWDPQFTWQSFMVTLGNEQLLTIGGYDLNTSLLLPQAGEYVYSVKLDDSGAPLSAMVSACN